MLLYVIDKSDNEEIRRQLTYHYCDLMDIDMFSLSDCSMERAYDFLNWLIGLVVEYGIPCNQSLLQYFTREEDISKYMYVCLYYRRCCICGKKADVHHCPPIGRGFDRKTIIHEGLKAEPLCREHHMEAGAMGQTNFDAKYHVFPITLSADLCAKLGLRKKTEMKF